MTALGMDNSTEGRGRSCNLAMLTTSDSWTSIRSAVYSIATSWGLIDIGLIHRTVNLSARYTPITAMQAPTRLKRMFISSSAILTNFDKGLYHKVQS